jgi:hypothetical protein
MVAVVLGVLIKPPPIWKNGRSRTWCGTKPMRKAMASKLPPEEPGLYDARRSMPAVRRLWIGKLWNAPATNPPLAFSLSKVELSLIREYAVRAATL